MNANAQAYYSSYNQGVKCPRYQMNNCIINFILNFLLKQILYFTGNPIGAISETQQLRYI